MIDATDFLNRVSLFSLVSQKDLQRIAGKARYHLFNEGDVIIREGDPDNRLFIIVSGEVEIIKKETLNNVNEHFGALTIKDGFIQATSDAGTFFVTEASAVVTGTDEDDPLGASKLGKVKYRSFKSMAEKYREKRAEKPAGKKSGKKADKKAGKKANKITMKELKAMDREDMEDMIEDFDLDVDTSLSDKKLLKAVAEELGL